MSYNYPQPQYQAQQVPAYGAYRPTPQYSQWGQIANPSSQVRPVSSIEEVRAFPIDFDGSIFYFTDVANRRIYTKQINLDGTVSINLYELKEFTTPNTTPNVEQPIATSSYVTKEEFENTILEIKNMYEQLLIKKEKEEKQQLMAIQQSKENQYQF